MEKSYEVLKKAIDKAGAKYVADGLTLSLPLVYKWCNEPESDENPEASGTANPLDRVIKLYELTGDMGIIQWLCRRAEGFLVKNPEIDITRRGSLISELQKIIKEFSDLLSAVSESIKDNKISKDEAEQIRKEWEALKILGESIAICAQKGLYHKLL